MTNFPIMKTLPAEKITKFTKAQVDQYTRANKEHMKAIGLIGCISLLGALIAVLDKAVNNKHDEKIAEHEERMMELEIEKLKLEREEK